MANEYLLATEAGLKAMPSYTFPFIVFHGSDDTLTDPDGSRTLFERSQVRQHMLLVSPVHVGRFSVAMLLRRRSTDHLAVICQLLRDSDALAGKGQDLQAHQRPLACPSEGARQQRDIG